MSPITDTAPPRTVVQSSDDWSPSTPTLLSRITAGGFEALAYIAITVVVTVLEFTVEAIGRGPFGDGFDLSNWWLGFVVMAVWHAWHWAGGQTPIGSYVDHYIVDAEGRAPQFSMIAARQIVRLNLVYLLPLLAVRSGWNIIVVAVLLAMIVLMIRVFDGKAPWDLFAGTVVTQSLAGEQAVALAPLQSVDDLRLSPQRVAEDRRARRLLFTTGLSSIVVSGLIVWSIMIEAWAFVSAAEFSWSLLTDIGWFPRRGKFDLSTLIVGTLWITGIAIVVAGPIGLGVAFYLSEYAKPRWRRIVKPVIETLASIPSVVLGFFAIAFISPKLLQPIGSAAGIDIGIFSILSAGIGVGILTIPIIASIAEDAMRAVPDELRQASYGLGSRRVTTCLRVVFPAALSGISAAFIVGISRAIGETMVVFLAAGSSGGAIFEVDPTNPGQTITAAMASLGAGTDSVAGSGIAFQSLYFLGALLFILTLILNAVSDLIVRRFRQVY